MFRQFSVRAEASHPSSGRLAMVALFVLLTSGSCGDPVPDEPLEQDTNVGDVATDSDAPTDSPSEVPNDTIDESDPTTDREVTDQPDGEALGPCEAEDACDDGITCTTDVCFLGTGACSYVPDHGACSDAGGVCSAFDGCIAPSEVAGISPGAPERIVEDPTTHLMVVESEAVIRLVEGATTGDLQDGLDTLSSEALVIGSLHTVPFAQVLFTDLDDQSDLRNRVEELLTLDVVAQSWIHPAGFAPTLLPEAGTDVGYVDRDTGLLLSTAWHLEVINAVNAWETTVGSDDVAIGMLDYGFATNLSDLGVAAVSVGSGSTVTESAMLAPTNLYLDIAEIISHGTISASLLGAEGNSEHGAEGDITGVMWESDIYAVRVDGGLLSIVAGAEDFALVAGDLSSGTAPLYLGMGLNYYDGPSASSPPLNSDVLPSEGNDAVVELVEQTGDMFEAVLTEYPNLLLIQGAGNEGLHGVEASFSGLACAVDDPVLADQVLCVSSATNDGEVAEISNLGGDPLAAPGGDLDHGLYGLTFDGTMNVQPVSGTSAAAAVTTGVAGLILSANPSLEPGQVHDILVNNGTPVEPEVDSAHDGFAALDAEAAVEAADGCVDGAWNPETSNCEACVPDCSETDCGPDPVCGEPCGDCGCGEDCESGQCVFHACDGRECGEDGCGGSCDTCDDGLACVEYACVTAPTFTVNALDDEDDTVCDDAHCSLREAITAAATVDGSSQIEFAVAGEPPFVISPTSALPSLSDGTLVDGTSQPGFDSTPAIEIDGAGAGEDTDGLVVAGDGVVLRSVAVYGFTGRGVELNGDGNTVAGCWIGISPRPVSVPGNTFGGIAIEEGAINNVGGSALADRNVVAGNGGGGVLVTGATSTGNLVLGNLIGTDADDAGDIGNSTGVILEDAGPTQIGGSAPGEGNRISGNSNLGIRIHLGGPHIVQGNWIGTDSTGSEALGNGQIGIQVEASDDVQIGCAEVGCGNIIAASGMEGIELNSAHGAIIEGNFIGIGADGVTPLGNGRSLTSQEDHLNDEGIQIITGDDIRIGGSEPGQGNHIAANGSGIRVVVPGFSHVPIPDGLIIQGNIIGSEVWFRPELGNQQYGIVIHSLAEVLVGGDSEGAGNVIGANGLDGMWVSTTEPGTLDIVGNFVGVSSDGVDELGNGRHGIVLTRHTGVHEGEVGGLTTVADNRIGFNAGSGIWLGNDVTEAVTHLPRDVAVLGNRIHDNGLQGIDLSPDGVTENDDGDIDGGGNDGQNFPVISDAVIETDTVTLTGTIDTLASIPVRIEFFANRFGCPADGHGQGERYLGFVDVTTDAVGHATFEASLPFEEDWPRRFTATATATIEREIGLDGDAVTVTRQQTSEHSACFEAACTPDCSGRDCGWNGCFGTCGECDESDFCANVCNAEGQCVIALEEEIACDYLDENCDGSVDEAFTVGGAFVSDNHCGTCGQACDEPRSDANATSGTCDSDRLLPVCVYGCEEGYRDANGVPSDGCECEVLSEDDPIEDSHPFIDANCDGVDGIDLDGDGSPAGDGDGQDCLDDNPSITPEAWDWVDGECEERTTWSMQNLDPEADEAVWPSVVTESNGDLALVYAHGDNPTYARVLRELDGAWRLEDYLLSDKQVSAGSVTAVLAADGALLVVYQYDDPLKIDGQLRVARIHEGHISVEVVDDGGEGPSGFLPSIAFDGDGFLHIAYTTWDEFARSSLYYATNQSGSWERTLLDGEGPGDGTDLAVDDSGSIHIVCKGSDQETTYFTNASGDWVSQAIDPDRDVREPAAISMGNVPGQVHFAYWSKDDEVLYYTRLTDSGWTTAPVAEVQSAGSLALLVDGEGNAHLSWNTGSGDGSSIVYATNSGGFWSISVPASGVGGGAAPSLALNGSGQPLVALSSQNPPGVRLALGGDPETVCGTAADPNCDGADGIDLDGDGVAGLLSGGTDCDDRDDTINPNVEDVLGDHQDLNCDGHDGVDSDGDGAASEASGGDDCDDDDRDVNPDATDTVGNDEDENCDDVDGVDGDGDGFANEASGGWDCEDNDTEVGPGDCTKTLVVIDDDDDDDGACDGSHCSLREALTFANEYPGSTRISFAVSGPIPVVITPTNPLPDIEGRVEIDGTTKSVF